MNNANLQTVGIILLSLLVLQYVLKIDVRNFLMKIINDLQNLFKVNNILPQNIVPKNIVPDRNVVQNKRDELLDYMYKNVETQPQIQDSCGVSQPPLPLPLPQPQQTDYQEHCEVGSKNGMMPPVEETRCFDNQDWTRQSPPQPDEIMPYDGKNITYGSV